MKIIFVRHGETDTNIRAVAGEEIVDDDAPLNAKGKSQAENVANELKDETVDVIFTSPKRRAIETADEIARFHNVPVIKMDDLRERDCGPITRELWHAMFNFDNKIDDEGIESITDFFQRVYGTIEKIKASGYKNVVVVSHGGVSHAFRAYANHSDWKGNMRTGHLGNCEYMVLTIEEN